MSRYRRSLIPGGIYFFTIALADRRSRLLFDEALHFKKVYRKVALRHPFVTEAICVLPEHVHAVWRMPIDDADYALRWGQIKSLFSRAYPHGTRSDSKIKKREKGIWQRRYWEHQIRDELDLKRHIDYVHYNPVKHGLVKQVKDWPYSSFHRYVRTGLLPLDWGGHDDLGDFRE
ncbi:MAG: transposase [Neisseriaceae bacterium]|nr:transposase [Neisseriaceae bacterium]